MREGVEINLREHGSAFRVVTIAISLLFSYENYTGQGYMCDAHLYNIFSHIFGSQGERKHSILFSLIRYTKKINKPFFSMDFSPLVNVQAKLIVHFFTFIANLFAYPI